MTRLLRLLFIAAIIIVTLSFGVQAQEIGIIQATATVISSLTVLPSHDLVFGNVTPGVTKAIDKIDVGTAGEWTITGSPAAEVDIQFSIPGVLTHTVGAATMPIIFTNSDASYDDGSGGGQTAPVANMNPTAISTLNIGAGGQLMVWIGGQVIPGIGQTGGNYAADVEMTVTLTGN